MAFLYITTKGVPWRKHSYSAGNDFDQSQLKYYLRRVQGWKERDNKAAFKFGRALEEAIQFYHDNNGTRGIETFIAKWAVHKDDKELKFSKTEKDWANLNRCGIDMMKLYIILQPSLPIPMGAHSIFQREYSKEVYPGDPNYGEIEDAGKLDIICYVDPKHPMLPEMKWDLKFGPLRPLIVDIKTGAKDFHEAQGMARYDLQLRRYSWLSGIRDVAFLWFKKAGTKLTKGKVVTLLVDAGTFKAGQSVITATSDSEEGVWVVATEYLLTQMEEAQGRNAAAKLDTTKAGTMRKEVWLSQNACRVPTDAVTRCRLQFNAARITDEEANAAGRVAGRQIQGIVNAWKTDTWDNTFGVRFPNDGSRDPYFQAFVLNDKTFRDLNFIKTDEQALDDLFADEYEDDGGEDE